MAPRFEAKFHHGEPLMVDHTPTANVAAGEVVVVGAECRIAHNDIEANKLGAVAAPGGNAVYEVKKAGGGGVTFADGALVEWDDTGKTAVANGTAVLGVAVGAAADADEIVYVRHQGPGLVKAV